MDGERRMFDNQAVSDQAALRGLAEFAAQYAC